MSVRAEELEPVIPLHGNYLSADEIDRIFDFRIDGHEIHEPSTDRGYVSDIRSVEAVSLSGEPIDGISVYEVRVRDPYMEADFEGYQVVKKYVEGIEDAMLAIEGEQLIKRSEASKESKYNRYTRAWVNGDAVEGVRLWRTLVPTAVALEYLNHPVIGRHITSRDRSEETPISPESAMQMRFVDDAVAIRERAVAMQEIVETHLHKLSDGQKRVDWLSLASGTAEPSIVASKAVEERSGTEVHLTVTDMDRTALDYVEEKAKHYDFDVDRLHSVQTNIVLPSLAEDLAVETGRDIKYDIVENMGFKEYLPQAGDELRARDRMFLPQASDFTRQAYSLVKPGGVLLSGNMVLPPDMSSNAAIRAGNVRSQLHYVFRIVDWPLINARSEEQILNIYRAVGILDDPASQIDMFRVVDDMTGLHIYNIVKVTKAAV